MHSSRQTDCSNRLLQNMSDADFARLSLDLTLCQVGKGHVLFQRDEPADRVWFPESGVSSILSISPEGLVVENGLFGRDGFAPVSVAMGTDRSPNKTLVQVAGECQTIPMAAFSAAMAASPALHKLLLRYAHTLAVQTAYTALSNAVHQIDERLARWLLMTHDRVVGSEMELTHDFLSIMLGVRRPSVTTALHVLEGNGFIRSERGCIIMRNRTAMEDFARDSYGVPEAEYERLVGPLR